MQFDQRENSVLVAAARRRSPTVPRPGVVLAATLICIVIALMLAGALTKAMLLQHRQVQLGTYQQQSFWLAESGVQRALYSLDASADYAGETWEVPAETLGSEAAGVVVIQVQPVTQPESGWDVRVESRYPAEALPRALYVREVFVNANAVSVQEDRG
ncbi:MAG: hypothetical protein ACYC6N_22485 [Pirellulaceae bacterium]